MLGLGRNKVQLVEWSKQWRQLFLTEKELLMNSIGGDVMDIQHVGSTSVEGMSAKPIIDIAIAVSKLEIGEILIKPLHGLGYEYRGDAGVPGRHFFAKGSEELRTVYIHVEEHNGRVWKSHVEFRDILRRDPTIMNEYQDIKRRLASAYPEDRNRYCKIKGEFIEKVLTDKGVL